jgi:hypothetical protein
LALDDLAANTMTTAGTTAGERRVIFKFL